VHVHHVSGARLSLLETLSSLGVPYGVTLHDHYFVCPTVSLLGMNGNYCGAPLDAAVCSACLKEQPRHADVSIEAWRSAGARLLSEAAFVIAPSQSVASTFSRYFFGLQPHVSPHGIDLVPTESCNRAPSIGHREPARHVVGLLGAVSPAKGARR